LFFGFASAFQDVTQNLPDIRVVIFRMKQVPHIDQTGLNAIEEVIGLLETRGIAVVMTGLREQPMRMLKRINLIPGLIPEQYLFETFAQCIEWLDRELSDRNNEDMHHFFDDLQEAREKNKLSPQYRL
jgi:sulfate permease, SulP family